MAHLVHLQLTQSKKYGKVGTSPFRGSYHTILLCKVRYGSMVIAVPYFVKIGKCIFGAKNGVNLVQFRCMVQEVQIPPSIDGVLFASAFALALALEAVKMGVYFQFHCFPVLSNKVQLGSLIYIPMIPLSSHSFLRNALLLRAHRKVFLPMRCRI